MGLVWKEQLSVGNDVIDADHKHLIGIINLVEKSLVTINRSDLTLALDSLTQYSKVHFAREEKIADAAGYTQIPHLHKSHEALLKKLDQVKQEIGDEWTASSVERFIIMLRDWLINHVIKEDMLMKPALEKYRPKFDGNVAKQLSASEKALIVDDSATMRSTLNAILVSADIEVIGLLHNGVKLLQTIAQSSPDIVCLDYNLPGVNGLELLKSIVSEHPQVAVVMITGEQEPDFRNAAAEAGAAGFIQKPFSQVQVVNELKSVIHTRNLLARANFHATKNGANKLVPQASTNKTAVVADDSKTMRSLLSAILSSQNIDVLAEAANGNQAVELVVQHRPDIVCLDIDMPGKNGLDALAEIRHKAPSSKVFMITGITKRETVMEAVKHGVAGFITKPFSPEKVGKSITKALGV
ncbi:MAG: bacteriohemerythrin [Gallionella sp.]|nr:bacteriohemerythrin [Gallionella sp.]